MVLAILVLGTLDVLVSKAINRELTTSDAYWRPLWDEEADGGRSIRPYGETRKLCRYDRLFGLYGYQFCIRAQGAGTLQASQFYWGLTPTIPLFLTPLFSNGPGGYRFGTPDDPTGNIPVSLEHPEIREMRQSNDY